MLAKVSQFTVGCASCQCVGGGRVEPLRTTGSFLFVDQSFRAWRRGTFDCRPNVFGCRPRWRHGRTRRKWTPLATPWINAQGLTGNSATSHYLWGDPADVAPFVVSVLNGRRTPTISSSDVDFDRLGMSFRVVYDFGVDQADPKAVVLSAGV